MSWKEKIENGVFEIKTGDGKIYKPLLSPNFSKQFDFNATIYDFINKPKSFVNRKNPRSKNFELIFFFQGENHLEEYEQFEISASDKRFWTVTHPIYGIVYGQPIAIGVSQTGLNTSEVAVDFWETIIDEVGILKEISSLQSMESNYAALTEVSGNDFVAKTDLNEVSQRNFLQNLEDFSSRYKSFYNAPNIQELQESVRKVSTSLNNIIRQPKNFISDVYSMFGYFQTLQTDIFSKANVVKEIYSDLKAILDVKDLTSNEKAYFETVTNALISSFASTILLFNQTNLLTKKQLLSLSEDLFFVYNDYFTTLEEVSVKLEDFNNYYILNFEAQNLAFESVSSAAYHLLLLSYDARQEREKILEKDSDIISLTHRFVSLDENDENINFFRSVNNLKNNNLFLVEKGTKIIYYV